MTEKRSMISIFGAEIASSLGLDYVVATIGDGGPSGSRSSSSSTTATATATPRPRPLDMRMSSVRRREATGGDLVADAMLWTPETGGWSCTFPNRPSESVRRQEGAGDGCAGSASGGAPTAMAMAIAMATSRVLLAPEQVVRAGGQHRGGGDDERAQRGRPRSRRLRRVRPRPRGRRSAARGGGVVVARRNSLLSLETAVRDNTTNERASSALYRVAFEAALLEMSDGGGCVFG